MNMSIHKHNTMNNPAWIERVYTLKWFIQKIEYYFPTSKLILKCECTYDDFIVPLILCTLYDSTYRTTPTTLAIAYVHPLICDVQDSKWKQLFQCVSDILREDALNQFVSFYGV